MVPLKLCAPEIGSIRRLLEGCTNRAKGLIGTTIASFQPACGPRQLCRGMRTRGNLSASRTTVEVSPGRFLAATPHEVRSRMGARTPGRVLWVWLALFLSLPVFAQQPQTGATNPGKRIDDK